MKWLPEMKPDCHGGKRDEHHTENIGQLSAMFAIVVFMAVIVTVFTMVVVVTMIAVLKAARLFSLRQVNVCFGKATGFPPNSHNSSSKIIYTPILYFLSQ
jgi:uncharacterized membrane protein